MTGAVGNLFVRLLRVPPEPEDPRGQAGTTLVFRASYNYFRYKRLLWAFRQANIVFGILVGYLFLRFGVAARIPEDWRWLALAIEPAALALAVISGVASYAMLVLDYQYRWYKVTDQSMRIREGVFFVREMTMTYANIQKISVSQGPLQRLLKIADLRVETAGGGGSSEDAQGGGQPVLFNLHVGYFRGIENAEEVRDLMRDRLRRYRDAGLGDHEDRAPVARESVVQPALASADVLESLSREARAFRASAERLAAVGGQPPGGTPP